MLEHLRLSAQNVYVVVGEIMGGAILFSAWWKRRRNRVSARLESGLEQAGMHDYQPMGTRV